MLIALTAVELNFDEFKLGGLQEKRAVVSENLRRTSRPVYLIGHGSHGKRKTRRDTKAHRQQSDLISRLLFFFSK
jgi:hypothetical protein